MVSMQLAVAPPGEAHLVLQADVTASFRLDIVPDLFDPGNDALADAWRQARRLVVVRDSVPGDRGDLLARYLQEARRDGRLDDYLLVDPTASELVDGMEACDEVVEAAAEVKLGRRDAFVAFGSARTGQVVTVGASSYRRWTPALRIHLDLASVVASIRDGVRVGMGDSAISALQRASHILVDEDGLVTDRPFEPDEQAALMLLGLLDPVTLERFAGGAPAHVRAEALATVLRLCRRIGPGEPLWQMGEAWLPLAPDTIAPECRPLWSLMLAARLAHRLGILPVDRLRAAAALAQRFGVDVAAAPDEHAVDRFTAGDSATLAVLLPHDDGEPVEIDRNLLRTTLTDLAALPSVPPAPPIPPGTSTRPRGHKMTMGARTDIRVPATFPVLFADHLLDDDNWDLAPLLPAGGQVLAAVDPYAPDQLARVHRMLARYRRHGYLARFTVVPVDPTDKAKTLGQVARILQAAEGLGLGPADRMLVIGGGTVMDIVGYAAYLYRGDTPYIRVPTTLVGMIDAGIGLKVGVNVKGHKNLMGAYHPPLACVCDTTFLATLAPEEMRCGLAEAAKIAMVCDGTLFELIEERHAELLDCAGTPAVRAILDGSIATMLRQLEANPFEEELRRLPDFGHEFGHVLEALSGYRLRHGEAVAIGMALSSSLAVAAGRLGPDDLDRLLELLLEAGLPLWDEVCDPGVLWQKLSQEVVPHKGGKLHLVVPRTVGAGDFIDTLDQLDEGMLRDVCAGLRSRHEAGA
jgi:2-epi-5-epi-valiolone synthase